MTSPVNFKGTRNKRLSSANVFDSLKKIFSTGMIVRDIKGQKVKVIDTQRSQAYNKHNTIISKLLKNQQYQTSLTQNYSLNRLALYRDYDMMDADPLLASAIDIYMFQSLTKDQYGDILKITSKDQRINQQLRQLFYQRLNCQFNFNVWFRNFVKYGDFFLALKLDNKYGVIGCQPISPYDIQRIQDDQGNSNNYAFRLVSGNMNLIDNYNIAHFRLLLDTNFLPYGRSVLQPVRRIWKNLTLMIDAMMIQRIMRAPQRRVFKIDVGDLPNQQVGPFMKDVIDKMKKVPYKDQNTGQINLKYNIQNLLQDFYIPVRGNQDASSIQTLSGMENAMVQDIQFIKDYLHTGLKIPKAFLANTQGLNNKCFSPNTKIKLTDGRVFKIKDLAQLYKQNPNLQLYTYSFDLWQNQFIETKIKWCQLTRKDSQIVRVNLSNGTSVQTTPDHNFILSNKTYVCAKDLKQNDKLLGFDLKYIKNQKIFYEPTIIKVINIQTLQQKSDTFNLQVQHRDHNILLHDNSIVIKQSTLAGMDIILSRYIQTFQNIFVNELNRIALIHLFILGHTQLQDIDFKLQLNNPSNVKQMQQLQLWSQKIQLATKMQQSGHFDLNFIYDNVYKISTEQAKLMLKRQKNDVKYKAILEKITQDVLQSQQDQQQQDDDDSSNNNSKKQQQGDYQSDNEPLTPQNGDPLEANNFRGGSPLHLD